MQEDWKYRTEQCTVPSGALDKTDRLFTAEVMEREERGEGGRLLPVHMRTHTHTVSQVLPVQVAHCQLQVQRVFREFWEAAQVTGCVPY